MNFEKGYSWFVALAFAAGMICCFLPQRSVNSGGNTAPNIPDNVSPAYNFAPTNESPSQSDSKDGTELPTNPSRFHSTMMHKFNEYDCTIDCSGHTAGFEWAERKSISDGDDCDAAGEHYNSPSFAEGCHAYLDGETKPDDEE